MSQLIPIEPQNIYEEVVISNLKFKNFLAAAKTKHTDIIKFAVTYPLIFESLRNNKLLIEENDANIFYFNNRISIIDKGDLQKIYQASQMLENPLALAKQSDSTGSAFEKTLYKNNLTKNFSLTNFSDTFLKNENQEYIKNMTEIINVNIDTTDDSNKIDNKNFKCNNTSMIKEAGKEQQNENSIKVKNKIFSNNVNRLKAPIIKKANVEENDCEEYKRDYPKVKNAKSVDDKANYNNKNLTIKESGNNSALKNIINHNDSLRYTNINSSRDKVDKKNKSYKSEMNLHITSEASAALNHQSKTEVDKILTNNKNDCDKDNRNSLKPELSYICEEQRNSNKEEKPKKKTLNPKNINGQKPKNCGTNNNNNKNELKRINLEKRPYINLSIENIKKENEIIKQKINEIKSRNADKRKKEAEIKNLKTLTNKWKKAAQDACYEIISLFPINQDGKKNTLKDILNFFRIENQKLDYDEDNDEFFDY